MAVKVDNVRVDVLVIGRLVDKLFILFNPVVKRSVRGPDQAVGGVGVPGGHKVLPERVVG